MTKFLPTAFLLMLCLSAFSQSFIQIRQKSLSAEVSTDFTYSVSGTGSYSATLNDKPDGTNLIFHIAGDADGGLFADAGPVTGWSVNPGTIHYKAPGASTWQNTGAAAFKVQGGSGGSYISLFRSSAASTLTQSADQIKFRPDAVSAESDITLNLVGERFVAVAHDYDNTLYVLVKTGTYLNADVGTIWKKIDF